MLVDWMWDTVLPAAQNAADERAKGEYWRSMCRTRTASGVACAAVSHLQSHTEVYAEVYADGDDLGIFLAAWPIGDDVATAAYCTIEYIAEAAASAGCAPDAVRADAWAIIDPVGLLERLVAVELGGS